MGWMNQGRLRKPPAKETASDLTTTQSGTASGQKKEGAEHVEIVEYPFCPTTFSDDELPWVPPDMVQKHTGKETSGMLWIVIDGIVYDCTTWMEEHPGGDDVIRTFGGSDCTWQFWRFHNQKHMKEYGLPLRIGRTEGVPNPYQELKRYSRLRAFDSEDW